GDRVRLPHHQAHRPARRARRAARRGEGPAGRLPEAAQAAGARPAVPPQPQGEVPGRSPPLSTLRIRDATVLTMDDDRTVVTGEVWVAGGGCRRGGGAR